MSSKTGVDDAPGNDNDAVSPATVTLTELADSVGVDEDELLRRLAGILSRREQ